METECDYQGCENEAEYLDFMENKVCFDCMNREVESGEATFEDFERIEG